jgi:release factor glutamine methyltransferase
VQLKQALNSAVNCLNLEQIPSPRMNAELLLMFVLSCDRAYLFAHPERELSSEEESRYDAVLAERARGVPAQYITGHQEFWGMDFIVTPAVLIPRPETEHLIEAALELRASDLGPRTSANRDPNSDVRRLRPDARIVDVGTGSGCIALALAK